jgi:hypothetical protein
MHTISSFLLPKIKMNIHNQCSNFNLIYTGYFSAGVGWNMQLNLKVKANSIESVDFKCSLATPEGVLTYQLEKEHVKPSHRPKPTYLQLFVAWKYEGYKDVCVFVQLIKCYKAFHWGEIQLEEYYQRCANQLYTYTGPIKDTWLINYDTVLMTGLELDFTQRDGALNITISEGVRDEYTKIPEPLDPKM